MNKGNGRTNIPQNQNNMKYVKLEWPEYQAFQDKEGFEEKSYYCAESDVYFVELEWYQKNS